MNWQPAKLHRSYDGPGFDWADTVQEMEDLLAEKDSIIELQEAEISTLKNQLKNTQRPRPPPPPLRAGVPAPPLRAGVPPPPPPPPRGVAKRPSNMFATNLRARNVAGHDASELAKVARRYVGNNLTNENIRRDYAGSISGPSIRLL